MTAHSQRPETTLDKLIRDWMRDASTLSDGDHLKKVITEINKQIEVLNCSQGHDELEISRIYEWLDGLDPWNKHKPKDKNPPIPLEESFVNPDAPSHARALQDAPTEDLLEELKRRFGERK